MALEMHVIHEAIGSPAATGLLRYVEEKYGEDFYGKQVEFNYSESDGTLARSRLTVSELATTLSELPVREMLAVVGLAIEKREEK